jgi:hypothetical protein
LPLEAPKAFSTNSFVMQLRPIPQYSGTGEVYVLIKFNDCSIDANPVMPRTNNIVHNF